MNEDDLRSSAPQTRAVHAGSRSVSDTTPVTPAIYQTSTFALDDPTHGKQFTYSRGANPTRSALEQALAAIEGGRHAYAFGSGLAAAAAMLDALPAGAHVVAARDVYGGTLRLLKKIAVRRGLRVSSIDIEDRAELEKALRDDADLLWVESTSNPLLRVPEFSELVPLCKENECLLLVDNTLPSPALFRPLEVGADIVLHSTSKFIGGHSDIIGGALITNDDDLAEQLYFVQYAVGSIPGPMDAFLTLRGLRTLQLRMRESSANALAVANRLEGDPNVASVHYPGLASHPHSQRAERYFDLPGAVVTVTLRGGMAAVRTFLSGLSVFTLAESLGGVESLISHSATMSHAALTDDERAAVGISDGTLRLSIGIEAAADLVADLERGLEAIAR